MDKEWHEGYRETLEKMVEAQHVMIKYLEERNESLILRANKSENRIKWCSEQAEFYQDNWKKIKAENIKIKRKLWRVKCKTKKMK